MASYTKTQQRQISMKNQHQMSILAQAKPAIISTANANATMNGFNYSTGILSEKINAALKLSSNEQNNSLTKDFASVNDQKVKHIEDDNVIQKQNASNQMRQAAVMNAATGQQQKRLSATERLAMTAKIINQRQQTTQPAGAPQQQQQQQQQQPHSTLPPPPPPPVHQHAKPQPPPVPSSKPAPLPTLETLLAVQRQLQRHTKQNLSSVPQDLVKQQDQQLQTQQQVSFNKINALVQQQPCDISLTNSLAHKLSPVTQEINHVTSIETYEKELPPLPLSVSPSTCTDESQLNSLESHQSSPATSLVSIPPPPPPISSYLQQYDEVNNSCRQSNSSTPSTSSSSEISSIKQFPIVPIKQQQINSLQSVSERHHQQSNYNNNLPSELSSLKSGSLTSSHNGTMQPPPLAPRPQHLTAPKLQFQPKQPLRPQQVTTGCEPPQQQSRQFSFATVSQQLKTQLNWSRLTTTDESECENRQQQQFDGHQLVGLHKPQINYQQHIFTAAVAAAAATTTTTTTAATTTSFSGLPSPSSSMLMPPPPPPPLSPPAPAVDTEASTTNGFDEPDCGSFRFPTPPPPDLLLKDDDGGELDEDEDDDDEFHCRIPTPPLHKSMSAATFQDLNCHNRQQHKQYEAPSTMFNSSTFSVHMEAKSGCIQPPPLFRQQIAAISQQKSTTNNTNNSAPQLTVHINEHDNVGLLSKANSNSPAVDHGHHIMMTMTASSPSSSSDGDGQSSNSSSSTSGIHSSIDSPSSSNSKLDDFNYSAASSIQKITAAATTTTTTRQHLRHHMTSTSLGHHGELKSSSSSRKNCGSSLTKATSIAQQQLPSAPLATNNSVTNVVAKPRPALKQKKTVSFSDKVELVACAEEQCVEHLPNPLLARVLAGKLQQ